MYNEIGDFMTRIDYEAAIIVGVCVALLALIVILTIVKKMKEK